MAKNTTSRDLRFYMDTHSTPMYLSTKLHVNWPKYKGDRMSYILPFERKINFWQYDQKYYQKNKTIYIATQLRQ